MCRGTESKREGLKACLLLSYPRKFKTTNSPSEKKVCIT